MRGTLYVIETSKLRHGNWKLRIHILKGIRITRGGLPHLKNQFLYILFISKRSASLQKTKKPCISKLPGVGPPIPHPPIVKISS